MTKIWIFLYNILLKFLPDNYYINLLFLVNCWRKRRKPYLLNLSNPTTFNEKLNSLKKILLHEKSEWADKLKFKEKVNLMSKKYDLDILTPKTLHIFLSQVELFHFNFSKLRETGFVIKANHGSGMNKIYSKGKVPDNKDLKEISKWFKFNSHLMSREEHYSLIEKRVFIEELLNGEIVDYKIHCFSGTPKYVQVDVQRFIRHKRNIFDLNWNLMGFEFVYSKQDGLINRPKYFAEMVRISELFSKIDLFSILIRIDFYEYNNQLYLGEVTFHPEGGVGPFDSYESDLHVGSFLNL